MRRLIIGGLVALAIGLTGCSAPTTYPGTVPSPPLVTYTPPAISTPVQTVAPAGIGVPVRDGSLEFTVHGIRRSSVAQIPGNPQGRTQAVGEYIIVSLNVKNIGSQPVQYYTDSQSLVINGSQHSADILAAVYLNPESAEYIQPGLAVNIETPFDVPVGSQPEAIVLNDIYSTPVGVTVSLVGAQS